MKGPKWGVRGGEAPPPKKGGSGGGEAEFMASSRLLAPFMASSRLLAPKPSLSLSLTKMLPKKIFLFEARESALGGFGCRTVN